MWTLLRIELFKIFRRPRTYIAFVAIAAIIILIQLAFYSDGDAFLQFGMQSLQDTFNINGKVVNGYLICYIILQTLLIHVPLLIALIAGDSIAGEANMGTLRLLVTKPISRTQFMLTKFMATVIYTLMLLVFMAAMALLLSIAVFGTSDLIILKSESIVILDRHDVLWRYFGAFGFAAIAMTTVASLAFLLSVFAENAIGPIVSTMSIVILCTILTTMDIPFFNAIKPYLFTNHMLNWKGFFEQPVNYREILKSASVLIGHSLLFVIAAITIFNKKDILS